tara:strand:- start:373 stop:579 length:207 start_codon:yes stop_codon:yes gene_type:complete
MLFVQNFRSTEEGILSRVKRLNESPPRFHLVVDHIEPCGHQLLDVVQVIDSDEVFAGGVCGVEVMEDW